AGQIAVLSRTVLARILRLDRRTGISAKEDLTAPPQTCRKDTEDRAGAGQDGADQAQIHPAPREKEGGLTVKLFKGHYTRTNRGIEGASRCAFWPHRTRWFD
ncbi:MAG: hypothetical protein ACREYE_23690, partial [Gammaproteobacteria bacterium]